MFYYIEGTVAVLEPALAVLDCGGVGYQLNISAATASRLTPGSRARLYVYTAIAQDRFDLFGFYDLAEKRCFEMLIAVSGVGPKLAMSVLSVYLPEQLSAIILSEDERSLTAVGGVGKRSAQRIILELKEKLGKESPVASLSAFAPAAGAPGGKAKDAAAALAALGYNPGEISAALKHVDVNALEVPDIVRAALQQMSK